jgi:Zn-dependent peptidase ImmA (M78 family)
MNSPYDALRLLARQKREQYGVTTEGLNLVVVKKIYSREGIQIDPRKLSPRIRAVYMCDEGDPSVMLNKGLPREPKLFTLVHELKHHFCDQEAITSGLLPCGDYNANRAVEVGAEVFAAEFIYPEAEFIALANELGIAKGTVTAEDIVRFKRAAPALVSYMFLQKRFERLWLVPQGKFARVKFTQLEEKVFGVPIYKQEWFKRRRALKARQHVS